MPFSVTDISLLIVEGMVVEISFFQTGLPEIKYANSMHGPHVSPRLLTSDCTYVVALEEII